MLIFIILHETVNIPVHWTGGCSFNMAESNFELMSLDNQFLLDYHREELIKKINISSSVLVDVLREKGTLTELEDEFILVRHHIFYTNIF